MGKCLLNDGVDEFLFSLHGRSSKKVSGSLLKKHDRTAIGLLLPECITRINHTGQSTSFHPLFNSFNRVVASGEKTPTYLALGSSVIG